MSQVSVPTPELRRAQRVLGAWSSVRVTLGILIGLTGFVAAIGAIMGAAAAAQFADGGNSNGGLGFMLMAMVLAAVMGLLPTIFWVMGGSAENTSNIWGALLVAALCLVGCALGHSFGGAFWTGHHFDLIVGGAAVGAGVLTLLALVVLPRHESAYSLAHSLRLQQQKAEWANRELPPPPVALSPWEERFII